MYTEVSSENPDALVNGDSFLGIREIAVMTPKTLPF
jgi:hypothetical protein